MTEEHRPGGALDFSHIAAPSAWDRVAPGYTAFIADHLAHYAADAIRLAEVQPGEAVLDVATGPGTLALQAARIAPVHALDFSEGMLDALRGRVPAELASNLVIQAGDGQALPLADDSFDVAFSMFGLFMFPDRARGFSELARVLRRQTSGDATRRGRAVVASWQPQDQVPALHVISEVLAESVTPTPDAPPPVQPLADPEVFKAEMSAAGFEVEVHAVEHVLESPSLDVLWKELCEAHVAIQLARDQLPAAGYQTLLTRIRQRLERALGPGPQRVAMPAWLALGRL